MALRARDVVAAAALLNRRAAVVAGLGVLGHHCLALGSGCQLVLSPHLIPVTDLQGCNVPFGKA